MINLNHQPKLWERVSVLVDQAAKATGDAQPARDYLGPSAMGHPDSCLRQVQYRYMGETPDFSGQLYRLFDAGHAYEEQTIDELAEAGFVIKKRRSSGGQIGFNLANGRFKGHCDGVIIGGPEEFGPYPFLFEHKALGKYGKKDSWSQVKREGVKKAKPEYYAQIQLYMAYLDLTENPAWFVARHRDSQQIFVEAVPFDPIVAQAMTDRAAQIIEATEINEMLPRIAAAPDFYQCQWCDFKEKCWEGG